VELAILVVALVLLASLIPPDFLVLSTLLVFLGTTMPMVNRGGALSQLRWVMLLVLALAMFLRTSVQRGSPSWHPIYLSLACFLLYAGVSSSYSPNALMTVLKAGTFACLAGAVILYARLDPGGQSGGSSRLLDQIYWCGVIVALGCVLALARGVSTQAGYFAGPFANPNSLGAFIPFLAPVMLLKLLRSLDKRPLIRVANVVLPIAYFIFLLRSRSRAGLAATFLASGSWLYFSYRKAFGLFVGGTLLAAVIAALYLPGYVESLNRAYVFKEGSYVLQTREKTLGATWDAAKENPLTGVGFGASKGYSEDWEFAYESWAAGREKGNSYLGLVEEVGLIGSGFLLFPLAWVLLAATRRLMFLRKLHQLPEEFWVVLTLSACLVGGLTDAFMEAWLTVAGSFSAVLLWLVFGVLAARLTTPIGVSR
jgi:hypothetical protein